MIMMMILSTNSCARKLPVIDVPSIKSCHMFTTYRATTATAATTTSLFPTLNDLIFEELKIVFTTIFNTTKYYSKRQQQIATLIRSTRTSKYIQLA